MGDLSKNFSRSEWVCKCGCGFDTVDAELVRLLQEDVRDYFNKRVTVTPNGGCRCYDHNAKCGGVTNSQHRQGRAADIKVADVPSKVVYDYLNEKYPERYGLGLYDTFVHVDTKSGKARRWDGRSKMNS